MKHQLIGLLALLCLSMPLQPAGAAPVATKPAVLASAVVAQPNPESLVRSMSAYMKAQPQFYVSGDVFYDKVFEGNNKIQYSFGFDYYVKRPGEFQFNFEGDLHDKQLLYNGKTVTIYDEDLAVYAVMDAPPTIDAALEKAEREYGLTFPILDIARSDFGDKLLDNVSKSAYVGLSNVGNIPCHHVDFVKEKVTMQLWIEAGDKPFLRKFLITLKDNPAMPSATVEISDWTPSPVLPEGWTTFVPKAGMKKVEFMKLSKQPATQTQ